MDKEESESDNSAAVENLQTCCERWAYYENSGCDVLGAEMIFVPLLIEDHYLMFVIDHLNEKIHYLDNIIWPTETLEYFEKLSFHVADQMDDFLKKGNYPKAEKIRFYKFQVQNLQWSKKKPDNIDSGVFVIYEMELYGGEQFQYDDLMTVSWRRFLRAKICATLVMSDMNASRSDVVDEVIKFNKNNRNSDFVKMVEGKRKLALAEQKRKRDEKTKQLNVANAQKETKEKRVVKKQKKYTPSKE
ncbi:hypothetical protein SOVF_150960 [Spinacia oleracea]|nr:hypothetical protein SOVF_150960 [Spinacia oleracea]